jgi:hypothetical protein
MKLIFVVCSALLIFGSLSVAGAVRAQDAPPQPWATDSTPPFDDVPTDHWAYQANHKLRDVGIVIGYPNGTFNDSKVDELADVPDGWEYQAVDTLQKAGIVFGYPDGTYGGRRAMTRQDFAVAIARLVPLINLDPANNPNLTPFEKEYWTSLTRNTNALEALR